MKPSNSSKTTRSNKKETNSNNDVVECSVSSKEVCNSSLAPEFHTLPEIHINIKCEPSDDNQMHAEKSSIADDSSHLAKDNMTETLTIEEPDTHEPEHVYIKQELNIEVEEPQNLSSDIHSEVDTIHWQPVKEEHGEDLATISLIDANTSQTTATDQITESFNLECDLSNKKTFTCTTCKASFVRLTNLYRHMRTHTDEKPFNCAICDTTFAQLSSLKRHMCLHTGDKPFTCTTCDAKFIQLVSLKSHVLTHSGERPFGCQLCDAKFIHESSLKGHMRVHTGEKPFSCETCDATFTHFSSLNRHIRTHTGEKPFICKVCDAKFSESCSLSRHMRTHTGEKPFTCKTCDAKFIQMSSLKSHMHTHVGKTCICKICSAKFIHMSSLKRHMLRHTGEKPYRSKSYIAKYNQFNSFIKNTNTRKTFDCDTGDTS